MYRKINLLAVQDKKIMALPEVKNYLRVSFDEDNSLIEDMIKAALNFAENFTGRVLIPKTYKATYCGPIGNEIKLPNSNISDVLNIYIVNTSKSITLEKRKYKIDYIRKLICFNSAINTDCIEIEYKVDESFVNNIPPILKQTILSHIAYMYDNRGIDTKIPNSIMNSYFLYRRVGI
jgi:uncharacterized phiE125 gp8 family phage protein